MLTQSVAAPICVGVLEFEVSLPLAKPRPRPSCPKLFLPHAHSVPLDFRARLWNTPALIAAQSELVPTIIGERNRAVLVPMPRMPIAPLVPQAQIVPSARRAKLK